MSDRIKDIKERLAAAEERVPSGHWTDSPFPTQHEADIAYLLAEIERLRQLNADHLSRSLGILL